MAFAALDLFVRIKAADPPFSVVLTDWLSMIPALGWRCFPLATRTSPRNRSCMSGGPVLAPDPKVVVDNLPRREVMR